MKVNAYWPNGGSIKIGILIIELVSKEEFSDYILRVFKITNSEVSANLNNVFIANLFQFFKGSVNQLYCFPETRKNEIFSVTCLLLNS